MPIMADYDSEARAMYVRLRDASVASSVEIDDDFVVDLDADSVPVGLELLALPVTRLQLSGLAVRFGFLDCLDAVWSVIQRVHPTQLKRSGVFVSYTLAYPIRPGLLAVGASSSRLDIEAHEFALSA